MLFVTVANESVIVFAIPVFVEVDMPLISIVIVLLGVADSSTALTLKKLKS